jgi:plasmid stabilization system protein ParE
MLVADLPRWLLAIATIDSEFDPATGQLTPEMVTGVKYQMIYADPVIQETLIGIADDLLDHIDRGELPEPAVASALPYVKAANAIADPDATADIDDLADLISRYEELKAAAKVAEDWRRTAQAKIEARMGTATQAVTSDGEWRVRSGAPIQKFTSRSETDFIELHCIHSDDCDPDCVDHRPELLTATLYRQMAKDEMPDEYEALRIPTPDRRLTIKNMKDKE